MASASRETLYAIDEKLNEQMEQNLFSKLIKQFLEANFPEFVTKINYQNDGSFDCSLKSNSKKFSIWIATYNSEITIGIEILNGNSDIHTHISCNEFEDFESCVSELSLYINNIKNDKLILYRNENGKYDWIELSKFKNLNNSERFYWND